MSEAAGALVNGPESRFVVAALEALLGGEADVARRALDDGAEATSWAAVAHRLDVAGRALTADDPDAGDHVAADADDPQTVVGVFDAWLRGGGLPATIDLTRSQVGIDSERERAWVGLGVLASLVERSGFPPQVVV